MHHPSPLEEQIAQALDWQCKKRGLQYTREEQFGPYRADFAISRLMLAIEAQSAKYHQGERRAKDRAKKKYIESLGWTVVYVPGPLREFRNDIRAEIDAVIGVAYGRARARRRDHLQALDDLKAEIRANPHTQIPSRLSLPMTPAQLQEVRLLKRQLLSQLRPASAQWVNLVKAFSARARVCSYPVFRDELELLLIKCPPPMWPSITACAHILWKAWHAPLQLADMPDQYGGTLGRKLGDLWPESGSWTLEARHA